MTIEPKEKLYSSLKPVEAQERSHPEAARQQRSVAAIALIALVIDSLTARSIILLAPFIRSALGISLNQYGYLAGAIMLGMMLTTLPLSSVTSKIQTRAAFGTILGVLGVVLICFSMQVYFYGLIVTVFVLGVLRAGIVPLVNRTIAERFDPAQRGAVLGFIFAAVPLGGFLGALFLPALAQQLSWAAGYRVLGIFALAGSLLCWLIFPRQPGAMQAGSTKVRLGTIFSKAFLILALAYGLFDISMATETFITLYLVDVVKISAVVAGIFFGLIQITGVGGRILWGIQADRRFHRNRWWLLAFTNALTAISVAFLATLHSHSPYWLVGVCMVGFGLSAASSWCILSILVTDVVPVETVAIATAGVYFLTNVGDTIGPVLFTSVIKLTGTYQNGFLVFALIAALTASIYTWMAFRWRRQMQENL